MGSLRGKLHPRPRLSRVISCVPSVGRVLRVYLTCPSSEWLPKNSLHGWCASADDREVDLQSSADLERIGVPGLVVMGDQTHPDDYCSKDAADCDDHACSQHGDDA